MESMRWRVLSLLASVLTAGLLAGCGPASAQAWDAAVLEVRPALPAALAAWKQRIVWRVTGSFMRGREALLPAGGALRIGPVEFDPDGDWILAEALLEDAQAAGTAMPALGWTSVRLAEAGEGEGAAMEPNLDRTGGCAAWLLGRIEAAGGSWRGLNLARLERELAGGGLDSVSLDLWRAYGALASGNLSARDLAARSTLPARIPAPPGEWLDCRGALVPAVDGGWLETELPLGGGMFFRSDGRASLRFTVRLGGDGETRVEAAERAYAD
jgi:hypothetical protein